MNPKLRKKVKDLVKDALDQPVQKRREWLASACSGNEELFLEAVKLLKASEPATKTLKRHFDDEVCNKFEEQLAGTRLGPWLIERELGRGGMGTVWLASRADDAFRMQVAVKVLKKRSGNAQLTLRFQRERQILADLQHAFIARLLDGGTCEDGRPYLVMEYLKRLAQAA